MFERSHRPALLKPSWNPPDLDTVSDWASQVGESASPILLVEGPTPAHRAAIYRLTKTSQDDLASKWLQQGVVENLTLRFSKLRSIGSIIPHEWDLLWNLLTLQELEVEEPIRSLIDQGLLFTSAFKAIWEARFRLDEGREIKTLVAALSRWMTAAPLTSEERTLLGSLGIEQELETSYERLDMLFFLATLAKQNHLLDPTILVLDGIEQAASKGLSLRRSRLRELYDFCVAAERWARLGSPMGFFLGYSNEHNALSAISSSNAKLGYKLRQYASV